MQETQGDSFKINAFGEWDRNFNAKGKEVEEPIYMGVLKCYCDIQMKTTEGFTKSSYVDGVRRANNEPYEA